MSSALASYSPAERLAYEKEPTDDETLYDFIEEECERLGKYEEAEIARTRLIHLEEFHENKRHEELRAQQLAERLGIEEAHVKEIQEFRATWDQMIADFHQHSERLQNELRERQQDEYHREMERLRSEALPRAPKWSRELLNLRRIQDVLAKQKKYTDAAKTRQQANALERREMNVFERQRTEKLRVLEDQLLQRQQREMAGMMKRIVSAQEEQKQARKTELNRLLQRYHNCRTQLENQQKIIRLRAERVPLAPATERRASSANKTPKSSIARLPPNTRRS